MPREDEPAEHPAIDWSQFEGLVAPTYTQTPDAIFDWIAPFIGCTELRVLLYITRRTFGFKKQTDAISVDQMCNGIVTRDGRRLDFGTQLKRATVLAAVKGLREKNLILIRQQSDDDGGSRPTLYSLNITLDPREALTGGIPSFAQQKIGKFVAVDGGGLATQTPPIHTGGPPGSMLVDPGVLVPGPRGPSPQTARVRESRPRGSVVADPQQTDTQQTDIQERENSKTSNARNQNKDSGTDQNDQGGDRKRRIYSARISQTIRDFSQLFHDHEHERSNRTRAMRLWASSDLDDNTFVEMMYEARKVAQGKGNITRDATDGSPQGTKNRMPYFFTVLEGLLEETVEE